MVEVDDTLRYLFHYQGYSCLHRNSSTLAEVTACGEYRSKTLTLAEINFDPALKR